jgi:hypothetical protein
MFAALLFMVNFAVTWFLVGMIWFVQLIHFPLYKAAAEKDAAAFEKAHTGLMIQLMFPMMIVELVTATLLLLYRPGRMTAGEVLFGLILIAGIWLATTFLVVPAHQKLSQGFDDAALHRLLVFNWLRTLGWSLRGLLMFFACFRMVSW